MARWMSDWAAPAEAVAAAVLAISARTLAGIPPGALGAEPYVLEPADRAVNGGSVW